MVVTLSDVRIQERKDPFSLLLLAKKGALRTIRPVRRA